MKKIKILLLLVFSLTNTFAQNTDSFFSKSDVFFKKYVKENKVDYDGLKKNSSLLDEVTAIASKIDISKEDAATTKAFWINAYNLHVIKGIVAKYPIKSPLDIAGFFDKNTFTIANKKITLNDIENKMLRAKYNDARFHFVLVCGANGCPPIINAAYMPGTLEEQLKKQTKLAVNNPNFIKTDGKKVQLSQIFEWYKEDFKNQEIEFINTYRTTKIDEKSKFTYYTYDWTLNKTK
jgi:Protein of unknown function, DUF547